MTFKIEAGKRYVAINGVVTGPLIPSLIAGKFKCPDVSIGQVSTPSASQVWSGDGTVYHMGSGESEHGLIAEYVEDKGGKELASALNRIAELEGINSSLEFHLFKTRQENANLSGKLVFTEASRKHWHDEWQKEKRRNSCQSTIFPGSYQKPNEFESAMSFARGGPVGVPSRDKVRNVDARIDQAFKSLNRLNRDVDEARTSANGRALFFGAFAGAIVVAVAFGAHFVL